MYENFMLAISLKITGIAEAIVNIGETQQTRPSCEKFENESLDVHTIELVAIWT